MKEAGVDDRRICETSGHRNTASLASYDRLSAHQAVSLSAAIDSKHIPETSVTTCHSDAAHAFSKATQPAASHSAFTLNTAGATLKIVTFNVTLAKKTKKRIFSAAYHYLRYYLYDHFLITILVLSLSLVHM